MQYIVYPSQQPIPLEFSIEYNHFPHMQKNSVENWIAKKIKEFIVPGLRSVMLPNRSSEWMRTDCMRSYFFRIALKIGGHLRTRSCRESKPGVATGHGDCATTAHRQDAHLSTLRLVVPHASNPFTILPCLCRFDWMLRSARQNRQAGTVANASTQVRAGLSQV